MALRLRARRQRTERFLIYTLQRHEHVQRGFGPAAWVELVRLAARDRTDAAIAKPERPFVRVDELGGQISGNAWGALHRLARIGAFVGLEQVFGDN